MEFYTINVAGLTRELPVCPINDTLSIAGFVMLGDWELTEACARELNKKIPEHDYLIAPEAKSIGLVNDMARLAGEKKHILARKKKKAYMTNPICVNVESITTDGTQQLWLDGADAELIKGKRVVIVDDVISTGESLRAVEELVMAAGGEIVCKAAVLAEGDAAKRRDIVFLEELPLFFK